MAIELRGFDDLQNDMVNMAYALDQGPGVSRALKAGAVPIEEQMLRNASTDPKIITDALHSSIHTGKVKQKVPADFPSADRSVIRPIRPSSDNR